mmetsp:Transcript_12841/g.36485  ORF Transcript_12841/g.36485 Transcript_12841/m.36485 type:complete len:286 (-) Transcript_12841:1151-2008(-)
MVWPLVTPLQMPSFCGPVSLQPMRPMRQRNGSAGLCGRKLEEPPYPQPRARCSHKSSTTSLSRLTSERSSSPRCGTPTPSSVALCAPRREVSGCPPQRATSLTSWTLPSSAAQGGSLASSRPTGQQRSSRWTCGCTWATSSTNTPSFKRTQCGLDCSLPMRSSRWRIIASALRTTAAMPTCRAFLRLRPSLPSGMTMNLQTMSGGMGLRTISLTQRATFLTARPRPCKRTTSGCPRGSGSMALTRLPTRAALRSPGGGGGASTSAPWLRSSCWRHATQAARPRPP